MSVEILAPAGGREQLIAAVRSGADAVYLGTAAFNARRNAENFDGDALRQAVQYCHGRGVKVHVTMNTLVKDMELASAYREIALLAESGVDAVLVQDLGVAALFRRHCPSMPLHASTQMTIHNLEGARAAEELGFSRVVLARELSLEEIRVICAGTHLEVEAFVHGALCMCVSGQCFLSSMLGERSGNRGLCAQPCRLNFRSGGREYALSLKDMSHIAHIRALAEAGVASLKIEGRMKRPEYVSAAVLACREALSGEEPDVTKLRAVFSRSGFTDGYATGKRDLTMFGSRTKEDVAASGTVLGELAAGYRHELARIPVDMDLRIAHEERALLSVTDGVRTVCVEGDIPESARTRGTDEQAARMSLSKTGGTPFVLHALTVTLDETLMLPMGKLNAMRKEALDKLLQERSVLRPHPFEGAYQAPESGRRVTHPKLRVRLETKEQLCETFREAEFLYLPLREIDASLTQIEGEKLVAELPRLTFPMQEEALEKRLEACRAIGIRRVCAGNMGSLRLAARMGFTVHGGFDLNILNTESLLHYEKAGLADTHLSCEIGAKEVASLGGNIARGILGYGHLPLMLFRNCPAKGARGCGSCDGRPSLTDRTGAIFPLTCAERMYSSLHNPVPLYLGDRSVQGVDFITLYFTVEDAASCAAIWEKYRRGEPFEGRFTRGLMDRKLL